MSKTVKLIIGILGVLLLICIIIAALSMAGSGKLKKENNRLKSELADAQSQVDMMSFKAKKLEDQSKDLESQISAKESEANQARRQYQQVQDQLDGLNSQISQVTRERDDWKKRVSTIREERDELMVKLQDRPVEVVEKIVYKEPEPKEEPEPKAPEPVRQAPVMEQPMQVADTTSSGQTVINVPDVQNEEYMARLLKDKAQLELRLNELRKDMDQRAIEIIDLKKKNTDYELEISRLRNERDEIVRKIKHGEDLANSLSIELARAKNEQKFLSQTMEGLKSDNRGLRTQVKQLTTKKQALQRSYARLSEEKKFVEDKLLETESIIQSRIDQIWKIKSDLDRRYTTSPAANSTQVELPPIVVSSGGPAAGRSQAVKSIAGAPVVAANQMMGKVVSINEDNNFAIVDLGETSGIQIGAPLKVFRGDEMIGSLEVIQLRKEISAADIKHTKTKLQVGDTVRSL